MDYKSQIMRVIVNHPGATRSFARVFEADSLYQMICHGALFCLSGAALAFMDDVISD